MAQTTGAMSNSENELEAVSSEPARAFAALWNDRCTGRGRFVRLCNGRCLGTLSYITVLGEQLVPARALWGSAIVLRSGYYR